MKNYCDITIILDQSGSMESIREATIKSVNGFIEEQKSVPGDGCWSLVTFDTTNRVVYEQMDQNRAPYLTTSTYVPCGGTALIDAVCMTIDRLGNRLRSLPEEKRPNRVLLVIVTDGEENSSKLFNIHDMNKRIQEQNSKYNWQFCFLGANQDAIARAASYGISKSSSGNFEATSIGISLALSNVSHSSRKWKAEGNDTVSDFVYEEN